jgi:hypothetical protein
MLGFWIDFRLTFFSLLALQFTWTLFWVIRVIQLHHSGAQRLNAEPFDREDYGFALGGSISSVMLLAVIVVLTQTLWTPSHRHKARLVP